MNYLFSKVVFSLALLACVSAIAIEKPHAVIVVGTHHYSPHQTMPGLAD